MKVTTANRMPLKKISDTGKHPSDGVSYSEWYETYILSPQLFDFAVEHVLNCKIEVERETSASGRC
jgi:hypothetical protein